MPELVLVPHENLGVAMMHGYAMAGGRPQAMMVDVGVGTANAATAGELAVLERQRRDRIRRALPPWPSPVHRAQRALQLFFDSILQRVMRQ